MATFRIYSWKWEEHVNMGKRSVSSPCKIVETCWNCRFCPPTRDGVKWQSLELDGIGGIRVFLCLGHVGHVEKGSCFFSTIPERFSDWPIQNRWPVMMFWQCNHPAFLAMSNLFKKKKKEIRIISPDGAGKHMPISMEIHGNHMGIHRMSMVFRLRLPWRLIPIVWLSEIYLSKCWFNREHVGYCWLFHNVKSAILDIVDYVSFICLFYLCCSWFLWYLFHHLCVCNIWIDVKLPSFSSFCPLPF